MRSHPHAISTCKEILELSSTESSLQRSHWVITRPQSRNGQNWTEIWSSVDELQPSKLFQIWTQTPSYSNLARSSPTQSRVAHWVELFRWEDSSFEAGNWIVSWLKVTNYIKFNSGATNPTFSGSGWTDQIKSE
jgi:hypothetical protein